MQHFKHVSGQFLDYTSPSGNATLNFLYTTSPAQLTDTGTRGVDTKYEPPVAFEVNVPQLRAGASSVNDLSIERHTQQPDHNAAFQTCEWAVLRLHQSNMKIPH